MAYPIDGVYGTRRHRHATLPLSAATDRATIATVLWAVGIALRHTPKYLTVGHTGKDDVWRRTGWWHLHRHTSGHLRAAGRHHTRRHTWHHRGHGRRRPHAGLRFELGRSTHPLLMLWLLLRLMLRRSILGMHAC